MLHHHTLERLEARIAPALVLANPLPDFVAGPGADNATIDLSEMFDANAQNAHRTIVRFVTSYTNPDAPTVSQEIFIELFDDQVPLTVQNFLSYVTARNNDGDYTGTFFHRAVPGFVLQGGGFQDHGDGLNKAEHIDVELPIHNEFDSSRLNLRGTLAMAKVAADPHSATSEFFFNVANNSGLDTQNGGFTVFGRVISGMEVVDAIVALPRATTGNDGPPVQNYDRDPDNDPNTDPPPVKSSSLIKLEEVEVIRPKGNAAGIGFSVTGVTDENGQPSSLVTATIVGTDLQLTYRAGASGVAKITVQGSQEGVTLSDDFLVTIKPNAIASVVNNPFNTVIVGGDTGKAKLRLGNNGGTSLDATVDVKFYLSRITGRNNSGEPIGSDPDGIIFDPADKLIGQLNDHRLTLADGQSDQISVKLTVPSELVQTDSERYRIIAKIENAPAQQIFTDDDQAIHFANHTWSNSFGTFNIPQVGGRTNAKLSYAEADGDTVTFSMKGLGAGSLVVEDGENQLRLFATATNSIVRAKTGTESDRISLGSLDISGPMRAVKLANVDLDGFFTAAAGARQIALGDITGDTTFSLGAPVTNKSVSIKVGHVRDITFESLSPIKSFRAIDWLDAAGAPDAFLAPSLGSLSITGDAASRGDFEADVTLSQEKSVGSFQVAGLMRDSTFISAGRIEKIVLGAISGSGIFAGTQSRPVDLPAIQAASDIGTLRITGIAGAAGFTDSDIVAHAFDRIELTGVDGQSGDGEFGIVADLVKRYSRSDPEGSARGSDFKEPSQFTPPGEADRDGNYVLRIL